MTYMFNLKTAKVVGIPNGKAWSQIHEFRVGGEKLIKRGFLIVVLTLKGLGRGIEAVAAGREILSRINEEYYGDLTGKPFTKLQGTLEKLSDEVQGLELVLGIFYDGVGYFGILGGGKIIAKRGSTVQTVLELAPGENGVDIKEPNLLVGSGFIQEGDLFLIGSKKFFESVARGSWWAGMQTGDPQEAMEILAPIVAGRENMGGVASVVVKAELESEKELVSPPGPEVTNVVSKAAGFSVIDAALKRLRYLRPRSVFIKRQVDQQKRKRVLFLAAALLIFLLLLSVVLGVRKRVREQNQAQFNDLVTQVETKLKEGRDLTVIKPSEAKLILKEALGLVNQAQDLKVDSQKTDLLARDINEELSKATREFQLEGLPPFWDLALVDPGAKGQDLIIVENQLIVLDKDGRRLISLDLNLKSAEIIAGGDDLAAAGLLTRFSDKLYVLSEKGILEIKDKKTKLVIETDNEWGSIVDLGVFAGNLYLLDSQKNAIWRYLLTDSGFGTRQGWLKENVDFADTGGFAIDGSIWVANKNKTDPLFKFVSGRQEKFTVSGLEKPLFPDRIYTDESSEKLYILDKANYRIVITNKQGDYLASYLWLGIAGVEHFVVSEKDNQIFLLAGSKIYEIGIR